MPQSTSAAKSGFWHIILLTVSLTPSYYWPSIFASRLLSPILHSLPPQLSTILHLGYPPKFHLAFPHLPPRLSVKHPFSHPPSLPSVIRPTFARPPVILHLCHPLNFPAVLCRPLHRILSSSASVICTTSVRHTVVLHFGIPSSSALIICRASPQFSVVILFRTPSLSAFVIVYIFSPSSVLSWLSSLPSISFVFCNLSKDAMAESNHATKALMSVLQKNFEEEPPGSDEVEQLLCEHPRFGWIRKWLKQSHWKLGMIDYGINNVRTFTVISVGLKERFKNFTDVVLGLCRGCFTRCSIHKVIRP